MKKIKLILSSLLMVMVFVSIKINSMSFYVYGLGISHCTSDYSCLHESAHALDDRLSTISHSKEYADAVRLYVLANQDDLSFKIVMFDGLMNYSDQYENGAERFSSPIQELYAEMYVWFDGDPSKMPIDLQKFYIDN